MKRKVVLFVVLTAILTALMTFCALTNSGTLCRVDVHACPEE